MLQITVTIWLTNKFTTPSNASIYAVHLRLTTRINTLAMVLPQMYVLLDVTWSESNMAIHNEFCHNLPCMSITLMLRSQTRIYFDGSTRQTCMNDVRIENNGGICSRKRHSSSKAQGTVGFLTRMYARMYTEREVAVRTRSFSYYQKLTVGQFLYGLVMVPRSGPWCGDGSVFAPSIIPLWAHACMGGEEKMDGPWLWEPCSMEKVGTIKPMPTTMGELWESSADKVLPCWTHVLKRMLHIHTANFLLEKTREAEHACMHRTSSFYSVGWYMFLMHCIHAAFYVKENI